MNQIFNIIQQFSIYFTKLYFSAGQELIDAAHGQSELVQSKIDEVTTIWTDLTNASEKKGVKLQEACQQQQYNRYSSRKLLYFKNKFLADLLDIK